MLIEAFVVCSTSRRAAMHVWGWVRADSCRRWLVQYFSGEVVESLVGIEAV